MINTIVAKTQMQFPYYLWDAEEETQLNKNTFDPLEIYMRITPTGKVQRRKVTPTYKRSRYMGHYTEDTIPKEYLIREMVFLKSNMVRICTVGTQVPYEFSNLQKDDNNKEWRTPLYKVAFHRDDIHPVKIKCMRLYGRLIYWNTNTDITSFLDWAYENNITLEVDPNYATIRPVYGKKVPPNSILKGNNLLYVGGLVCDYRKNIKLNWQGTIFSKYCDMTYGQLESVVREMSQYTHDICICESQPGVYSIINGALSVNKLFRYTDIASYYDLCIPQALFDEKNDSKETYRLTASGDVLIPKFNLSDIKLRKTFLGKNGGTNIIVLGSDDDGARWLPYNRRKLVSYKAPTPYELYRYKKPVNIVYDSQVPLEKKETSNKRRTRLNLKYTPKNPGMYGDDDLTSYNKYMGEVDKGNFEIISAQSERIVNIANISEFRNLGFLYYLLLKCYGNSGLYPESKILKRLAIAFPEIIQCECNTYFLNRQLATLKQCLENFNKIKNKNLQKFLIEISSFTLSVDQTACKKILMQCL